MTDAEPNHSVQGSWRGHFYYAEKPGQGHGFEAVFVDMNGIVEGNILDDDNLGEAVVGGSFHYPNLQFTKIYRNKAEPIKYYGTMSDDGKELSGSWMLSEISGTWRATRDGDGNDVKFEDKVQAEEEPELVRIRPRTRPAPELERERERER
jgi:hypothetical protein